MVDVALMVHKPPQHGAPTPPRHCRKVCEGKQEMLLLANTHKYLETCALLSCWTLTNSAPELLGRAKTVHHSPAVKVLNIELTMSSGLVSRAHQWCCCGHRVLQQLPCDPAAPEVPHGALIPQHPLWSGTLGNCSGTGTSSATSLSFAADFERREIRNEIFASQISVLTTESQIEASFYISF